MFEDYKQIIIAHGCNTKDKLKQAMSNNAVHGIELDLIPSKNELFVAHTRGDISKYNLTFKEYLTHFNDHEESHSLLMQIDWKAKKMSNKDIAQLKEVLSEMTSELKQSILFSTSKERILKRIQKEIPEILICKTIGSAHGYMFNKFSNLNPDYYTIRKHFLFASNLKPLIPWTLNSHAEAEKLLRRRDVVGVITNSY